MRISIIGQPASGKSTLAKAISKKLGIPHIHIDRFWFEGGGLKVEEGKATPEEHEQTRAYVRTKVLEAIAADAWVSDGFYSKIVGHDVAARADVIIYTNIPLWRRLFAHWKRIFGPSRHPELKMWHELYFFYELVKRTYVKGPLFKKFTADHRAKVVELRSWKEMDEYLAKLVA